MQTHQKLNRRWGAAFSIAALIGVVCPLAQAAPAPDVEQPVVRLVVDTGSLEESLAVRLHATLEEQLTKGLLDDGFAVVEDGAAAMIVAYVEMPDVALRKYMIGVDVIVDDKREVVAAAVECEACSERQVVEKAVGLMPVAAQRLSEREPPAPAVEQAAAPVIVDDPRRLKLGPIGLSGAVTVAGGVTLIAAGAVLARLPKTDVADIDPNPRVIGASVLVVGGVAAALGIVAVVVDVTVLERRRRARRLEVSADLSATRAGFSLSGRF